MRRFVSSLSVSTSVRPISYLSNVFLGKACLDEVFPYPARFKDTEEAETVTDFKEKLQKSGSGQVPGALLDLGLYGMGMPLETGGLGLSYCAQVRLLDDLSQTDPRAASRLRSFVSLGSHAVRLFGSKEQKGKYIQKFVDGGQLATLAYQEAHVYNDNGPMTTEAVLGDNGSYRLSGIKSKVRHANDASHFIVLAKTDTQILQEEEEKATMVKRLTMFIVPKGPQVSVVPSTDSPGLFDVTFAEAAVPVEDILGVAGQGHSNMLMLQHCAHITQSAVTLGRMRSLLKTSGCATPLLASHFYAAETLTYLVAACMDREVEDHLMEDVAMKSVVNNTAAAVANAAMIAAGSNEKQHAAAVDAFLLACEEMNTEGQDGILNVFMACVGCEDQALYMKDSSTLEIMQNRTLRTMGVRDRITQTQSVGALSEATTALEKDIAAFGEIIERLVVKAGNRLPEQQTTLSHIANVAAQLYARAAVLARAAHAHKTNFPGAAQEISLAQTFCAASSTIVSTTLQELYGPHKHIESTNTRICNDVLMFEGYIPGRPDSSAKKGNE